MGIDKESGWAYQWKPKGDAGADMIPTRTILPKLTSRLC
jgi:hypothetical protein